MRVDRHGHPLKVMTDHVLPPIPVREWDWCAWYDGHEFGPRGWGRTEEEARAALEENRVTEWGEV